MHVYQQEEIINLLTNKMKININSAIKIAVSILLFVLVVGGLIYYFDVQTESKNGIEKLPCESPFIVELGSPVLGGPTAEFTTNGETIFVKSTGFDHNGILAPKRFTQNIYVGFADKLPTWKQKNSAVSTTIEHINFFEGNYGKLTLKPGRYWLWSGAGYVSLFSCKPGVISDPKPTKVGEPNNSAALTCGYGYTVETAKSTRLPASNQPSGEFTVPEKPIRPYAVLRNIGNNDIDTLVSVYIGEIDKLPTWDNIQSILKNSALNFLAEKGNYYNLSSLTPGQNYWILTNKDADIEFMNCVPKTTNR